MSLREETNQMLRARRQRLINGGINTIPSPFKRFSRDFLGLEQATYMIISSFTKGKSLCNLSITLSVLCKCKIRRYMIHRQTAV